MRVRIRGLQGRSVASSPRGRRRTATAQAANTSATGGGRYFFRGKPNPQIVSRPRQLIARLRAFDATRPFRVHSPFLLVN